MTKLSQPQRVSLLLLRLGLGILFLWAGYTKATSGFSAAGYLKGAQGPFASIFHSMAGNSVVDFLVTYGEIGIGVALVTGTFVTFAVGCGVLMLTLFYFSKFPPQHGLVNDQLTYILGLLVVGAFHAGQWLGGDGWLKKHRRAGTI